MEKEKILQEINFYEFFKSLNQEETMELIHNAKTKEEKEFYAKITDYLLQENQKKLIGKGI